MAIAKGLIVPLGFIAIAMVAMFVMALNNEQQPPPQKKKWTGDNTLNKPWGAAAAIRAKPRCGAKVMYDKMGRQGRGRFAQRRYQYESLPRAAAANMPPAAYAGSGSVGAALR